MAVTRSMSRKGATKRGTRGKFSAPRKKAVTKKKAADARAFIGAPIGLNNGKRLVTHNAFVISPPTSFDSRTLKTFRLSDIPTPDGTDSISKRERDIVNCQGISIQYFVKNLKQNQPTTIRCAVITAKDNVPGLAAIPNTEFFRSYGSTRAEDFGVARSSLELLNNPINTDRFHVLRDIKIPLIENSVTTASTFNQQYGTAYKWKSMYIKIDRQLSYLAGQHTCLSPIYLVFWADLPGAANGEAVTTGAFNFIFRSVIYFREPK